jgi:hypothetical protein
VNAARSTLALRLAMEVSMAGIWVGLRRSVLVLLALAATAVRAEERRAARA